MLRRTGDGTARNVDMVLDTLRHIGYTCGYDMQDACEWWVPQTRARVYIWGYRLGSAHHCTEAFDNPQLRLLRPGVQVPLADCLLR